MILHDFHVIFHHKFVQKIFEIFFQKKFVRKWKYSKKKQMKIVIPETWSPQLLKKRRFSGKPPTK